MALGGSYQLVHGDTNHVLGSDNGARDGEDGAILVLVTNTTLLGRHPDCPGSGVQVLDWDGEGRDQALGAVGLLVELFDKIGNADTKVVLQISKVGEVVDVLLDDELEQARTRDERPRTGS